MQFSNVITSIVIQSLRGVREGKLDGLTPLVVLVGPNGSGKSTILDALLIGAGRRPAACAGYAVQRRGGPQHGARWLFYRGIAEEGQLHLTFGDGTERRCVLSWSEMTGGLADLRKQLTERGAGHPYSAIRVHTEPSRAEWTCLLGSDNTYAADDGHASRSEGSTAWLVDSRHGRPLHDLYSRLSEHGRRQALLDLVTPLVPGLRLFEVLTDHGSPRLSLSFNECSIPVALAGDGIQTLIRLALEFATHESGTALLEEPEAHQHPAAIGASAKAIVAGVRSGLQIVLTTHSMELLDGLLDELAADELDLLTVYRLKLDAGMLSTSRFPGPDVLRSRGAIEADLR